MKSSVLIALQENPPIIIKLLELLNYTMMKPRRFGFCFAAFMYLRRKGFEFVLFFSHLKEWPRKKRRGSRTVGRFEVYVCAYSPNVFFLSLSLSLSLALSSFSLLSLSLPVSSLSLLIVCLSICTSALPKQSLRVYVCVQVSLLPL
jgi:hypothetical protein